MSVEYDLAYAGPELRDRVTKARKKISAVVRDLNIWLAECDLAMTFRTSVQQLRYDQHVPSATLKAHLKFGFVKPEEMEEHLAKIREAEAVEARHAAKKNLRNELKLPPELRG